MRLEWLAASVLLLACSDGGSSSDAGASASHPSLASAGTQLLVEGPDLGLQLTEANLADDVDLVASAADGMQRPRRRIQSWSHSRRFRSITCTASARTVAPINRRERLASTPRTPRCRG